MASGREDVEMADSNAMDAGLGTSEQELNEKYPNRPRNHSKTLPFHDLFLTLFNPLNENQKRPTGPSIARKKRGPHGPSNPAPQEVRRHIVERFISRWREEVGNDIHPAFRLIVPEKDRDRAMYGLKEKTIGKLLIRVMQINKDSEDGLNLLNWKQPGQTTASRMAGDFAGRCYEVISKRPLRTEVGNMSIAEVNDRLDRLSAAQKEDQQAIIFAEFYRKMSPDELMWLIRIILRQMKVGATERTFFALWHPDAEQLFSISSNLRRVCWELYDPAIRLEGDDRGVTLMQCFQPQLAQFQIQSMQKIVDKMRPTEDDDEFWIEEKLDGERMQLHMMSDNSVEGGKRFAFWSRKAKDYTYLYGNGLMDAKSALTRHLKHAFDERVDNIILDGEMITWDSELDVMLEFGTLKTAALAQQQNPFSTGPRPLYKVFDILYANGRALTSYVLRDRRKALESMVKNVERRMEIHTHTVAHKVAEIEPMLHKVIAERAEGLVLKNPRSAYRLNERNDDWMKVKPEYMDGFGEDLDCVVIGGYYGSGRRGGNLSSFLCGLRVDENQIRQGANPMKCYSFFKVGGGFTAADYAQVRHCTEDKWHKWDPKRPPTDFIELGGGALQFERPDVWIRPDQSVVFAVKAAQVSATDQFRTGYTLRFPRFKKLRHDRDWQSALSLSGFNALKSNVEKEQREKKFKVDDSRKRKQRISRKKPMTVAGNDEEVERPYDGLATELFAGLNIFVMTDAVKPTKKKADLEYLIKANGGTICQRPDAVSDTLCVGDKRTVSVASLIKRGKTNIIRQSWILDCIAQTEADGNRPRMLLPLEPKHMFFTAEESKELIRSNTDEYGDSYTQDVTFEDLRHILENMPKTEPSFDAQQFQKQVNDQLLRLEELRGSIFENVLIFADTEGRYGQDGDSDLTSQRNEFTSSKLRMEQACTLARFAGARFTNKFEDLRLTHVLVGDDGRDRMNALRRAVSSRQFLPRLVTMDWIEQSWQEKTLLDEERKFAFFSYREVLLKAVVAGFAPP
ncbi:MAG: hypothetical protein Q9191_000255 [Dirinaria sp. TL-2023a]